jgi:hypothetical protein
VTIFFVGGEPADFTFNGAAWAITTDGTRFRTDKARCAITTTGGSGVKASFSHPNLSTVWFGCYMHVTPGASDTTWTGDIVTWTISGTTRMILRAVTVSGVRTVRLLKVAGATETVLATSTVAFPMGINQLATMVKWSETTGQVSVWKNETLLINFIGNPIPSGSTGSPNGISIGCPDTAPSASVAISEVLVDSQLDIRTMACYTLAPTGNGDVNQWVGGYAEVDEIEPNDADTISANAVGKRVGFTIPVPSGLTAENRVRAVKVVARASKGDFGPGSLKIGLRQAGVSAYTDTPFALTTTPAAYSGMFYTNPATAGALTVTDLNTLQLAFETA